MRDKIFIVSSLLVAMKKMIIMAIIIWPLQVSFAGAKLQGLDRTTAHTSTFNVQQDASFFFGRLEVIVRHCKKSAPTEAPESTAFLEIYEYPLTRRATIAQMMKEALSQEITDQVPQTKRDQQALERIKVVVEEYGAEILEEKFTPDLVFSGWMFSSSPPLNALEHPVYDIWVLSCVEEP